MVESQGLIIFQLEGEEVGAEVTVLQYLIVMEVTQAPTVPLYRLLRHMDRHIPRLIHIQVGHNGAPTVPIKHPSGTESCITLIFGIC